MQSFLNGCLIGHRRRFDCVRHCGQEHELLITILHNHLLTEKERRRGGEEDKERESERESDGKRGEGGG